MRVWYCEEHVIASDDTKDDSAGVGDTERPDFFGVDEAEFGKRLIFCVSYTDHGFSFGLVSAPLRRKGGVDTFDTALVGG